MFRLFDRDGNGKISREELSAALHSLGQEPTAAELQEMLSDVDKDRNGTIDFEEFRDLIQRKMAGADPGSLGCCAGLRNALRGACQQLWRCFKVNRNFLA